MKLAVISAILEEPAVCQKEFNDIVSEHNNIVKGRLGIPFHDGEIGVISLTTIGAKDEIEDFIGKLNKVNHCTVNSIYSKKDID